MRTAWKGLLVVAAKAAEVLYPGCLEDAAWAFRSAPKDDAAAATRFLQDPAVQVFAKRIGGVSLYATNQERADALYRAVMDAFKR